MNDQSHDPISANGKAGEPVPDGLGLGVVCGAKTKSGGICSQAAMPNGRCRAHGGRSAKGIKAGAFKTGRYSKALAKLDADIGDRVNDPKLVDPRRSIAVQEFVLGRLNEMLDEKDSPEFRENVRRMLGETLALMRTDPAEALIRLGATKRYADHGVDESRALSGMKEAADAVNKSQTRYWQTAMHAARSISPEEFIQLMFRMTDIIETEVDADAARRILGRTDRELCGGAMGLGGK